VEFLVAYKGTCWTDFREIKLIAVHDLKECGRNGGVAALILIIGRR
jgi:hypothetical protein